MDWRFKDGTPLYSQIVEQMKNCIAGGDFEPGEKIPAVRELAVGAGVNPNTMQKALAELEREGLLFSERTSGRYVTEDREVINEMKVALSREFVKELFENLGRLGMSEEEIKTVVANWEGEGEK
ncbi:MAG: GntR family transcriptional regulator [Bacillota bacterium]|nr:GntR family transcriptional regulator [Bacillota bacterium]